MGTRGLAYRKVISEAGLSPFSGTRSWTEKRAEFSAHFSVPEAGPKSGPSSQPVFRHLILCRNTGQGRRPIFGLGTRPVLRAKKTARFRFAIRGFAAHFFTARASAATRVLSQAAPRRALFIPSHLPTAPHAHRHHPFPLARQPSPPRRPRPFFRFPFPSTSSRKSTSFLTHIHHRKRKPHNRRHFRIQPLVSSFTPPLRRC